jgi:hypothetical protein
MTIDEAVTALQQSEDPRALFYKLIEMDYFPTQHGSVSVGAIQKLAPAAGDKLKKVAKGLHKAFLNLHHNPKLAGTEKAWKARQRLRGVESVLNSAGVRT